MSIHLLFTLIFPAVILTIVIGVPYLFLFGGSQKFLRGTLLRRYDGLELHNEPQTGDVHAVYHTYRGLLIWFTQDEHRVYGPPEEVRTFLQRMLKFNLTWGLLSYGALFIPILAIANYYAQLRSISKQLSTQATDMQLGREVQAAGAFTSHNPGLSNAPTEDITPTRSLFHRVVGWIAAGLCFIFGMVALGSLAAGEFETAAGGIFVTFLFGSVARDWLGNATWDKGEPGRYVVSGALTLSKHLRLSQSGSSTITDGGKMTHKRFPARVLCTIICLGLCGCPTGGGPNSHYRPVGLSDVTLGVCPTDDRLVFNGTGTGGRDLFVFDLTSQKVTRLTDSLDYEVWPAYSPDGKQIVYCAGVPGDRADHVFVHSLIDNSTRQLTTADANDGMPVFSPDGSQIVFARDKTHVWGGLAANWSNGGVICVVNSDGSNERQLTDDDLFAYRPQFSPDGKFVSFSTLDGRFSIPVDGSGPATRLPGPADAHASADGRLLAYTRGKYWSDTMLYVSDSDGANERQLTQGGYQAVFGRANDRLYMLQSTWPDGPTGHPVYRIEEVLISNGTRRAVTDWEFLNAHLKSDGKGSK